MTVTRIRLAADGLRSGGAINVNHCGKFFPLSGVTCSTVIMKGRDAGGQHVCAELPLHRRASGRKPLAKFQILI